MENKFEYNVAELAEQGWTVLQDFLPADTLATLYEEAQRFLQEDRFRQAGVGRGTTQGVQAGVRSDQIYWLNEQELTAPQAVYWDAMDTLRQALNRTLFLSLISLEAHYAVYAPGAFYQKHVDRFQSSDERMLSTTLYLNPDWNDADGGQLRLYHADSSTDVLPRAGTFTLFRSDTVYHEVLPATRPRFSLTGWFRRRSLRPF